MSDAINPIFERAFRDGHANETRWPWYSNIAPISWLIANRMNQGRRHPNVSEWDRRDEGKSACPLREIGSYVRKAEISPASYSFLHRGARLSSAGVKEICESGGPATSGRTRTGAARKGLTCPAFRGIRTAPARGPAFLIHKAPSDPAEGE